MCVFIVCISLHMLYLQFEVKSFSVTACVVYVLLHYREAKHGRIKDQAPLCVLVGMVKWCFRHRWRMIENGWMDICRDRVLVSVMAD